MQEQVSGDAISFVTPKSRLHAKTCEKGCNEEFMAIASDVVMLELGLSLADLRLNVRWDQEIPLENQELLAVRDLLKLPPSIRGAEGGSTCVPKTKRNQKIPKS